MAKAKDEPQGNYWHREIEDQTFEDAISTMRRTNEAAKENREARRLVADKCKEYDLKPEEVIRCGRYTVTGAERNGGGFEVPAWTSTVVKNIAEV